MKHRFWVFVFVAVLFLVFSAPLVAQPEDEEDEGPIQAMPNPRQWSKFSKMTRISSIVFYRQNGNRYSVGMRGIKMALERAGICVPVKIQLKFHKGKINLGYFKPTIVRRKRSGKSSTGPLRGKHFVRFKSIGARQSVKYDGFDGESKLGASASFEGVEGESQPFPATLVFLDGKGTGKAALKIKIIFK